MGQKKAAGSKKPPPDTVSQFVPLAPAPLHIVLALNRGERHGYALMGDVDDLSGGVMKMGPGTLYGTLKKLVGEGLIEETASRTDPALDDQRRRYYRLTAMGQAVCNAEIGRLAALIERSRSSGPVRLLGGST
jgi:DNA-binding PadR family transcriptional regulator